jgi:hypothetical protein
MTEKHSQIEVCVFDHTGKILDKGIVILEAREQIGAPKHTLKFDPRRACYVGFGNLRRGPTRCVRRRLVMPQMKDQCRWIQLDRRRR